MDRKKGESKTGFTLVIVVQSGGRKTFPNGEMMDKTTNKKGMEGHNEKDHDYVVINLNGIHSKSLLFTREGNRRSKECG
jgi:hypothetical protein